VDAHENTWQMTCSPSKCSVLHTLAGERKDPLPSADCPQGQTLDTTNASKCLGPGSSQDDLSWTSNVKTVAALGHRTVGFFPT